MIALYRRWRHTRGFGVHSPFAFRFVRDVLREHVGYGYYTDGYYHKLTADMSKCVRHRYAICFRIVARLAPKCIFMSPQLDTRLESLLHKAEDRVSCRVSVPESVPDSSLVICLAEELNALRIRLKEANDVTLVILYLSQYPRLIDRLASSMPGGWIFEGKDMAVLVSRSDMDLYRLRLNLP